MITSSKPAELSRKPASQAPDSCFAEAVSLFQLGRLDAADALCRHILTLDPKHRDALNVMGIVALQQGNATRGEDLIRRSLEIDPAQPFAHCNLGNAYRDQHRPQAALASYRRALEILPDFAGALYGEGNALCDLARAEEAIGSYDRAIGLQPDHADAHHNRGNALGSLGRGDEALASYRRALSIQPSSTAALANCAEVLERLGRPQEALSVYDQWVAVQPDSESLGRRGHLLLLLDRPVEALTSFERAAALQPDAAQVLDGLGMALLRLKRHEEALAAIERALRVDPSRAELLYRRAATLRTLRRHEDAARAFEAVLAAAPDHDYALGNLVQERLQSCDWAAHAENVQNIDHQVREGRKACIPGPFLCVSDSAERQYQCATVFAGDRLPMTQSATAHVRPVYGHDRIRVAYVSGDFRDHPVSQLLAGVVETHDRRRFETIAISLQPEEQSPLGRRIRAAFDRVIDVGGRTDRDVAETMRRLEVDIAVDLMGLSGGSRPLIFAQRPAPVQVSYLGFPGTQGTSHLDYIVADRIVIPEADHVFYSENVVYLPGCFQPNDARREIAARTPTRAACGLPQEGFVFCCFNGHYKITPAVFDGWMRLLRAVEGSVLWLSQGSEPVVRNLRREALNRGVAPERLVFADRLPSMADHLARYRLADLFLDTMPYNAHTTASDALWAGLPVLTLAGHSFASRVAASLLMALDLPELIAVDLDGYESMARRCAAHPALLGVFRSRLARNRLDSALFDTRRYCRHLETAYGIMRERAERGEKPRGFSITDAITDIPPDTYRGEPQGTRSREYPG
ncbi:MAG: tetratricopeptide repeat protein [Pseudomonadota bacterium]|nr:tetratricopeptide repeat protein [Pseudomonadota bacterium]